MEKGENCAIDIETFGNANNNVNVSIKIYSAGDPTPGENAGTTLFNINGSDNHIITGSGIGINTTTIGANSLNVNGNATISRNVGTGIDHPN